ncbi:response regulator transcription factor [Megasphaera elsdenii]|jgi:two-component system alkaline phosphatase synthesis response regulator PhoP|uniref:Two component transcriptional regulator n=1 Tax=Megasphaera elsdenii DSM 20460 TaxID=1064535 RepID=G0VR91_MEGEL|nr:response regulator transcription factor [Megasphaera elsdenii]AVO73802.1 DNA-binding response regulator [Megasphaera elsdenii DSM 20460]MCI6924506.1 response regulator transcription factor [Megasphaera elsdenii]MDD6860865.1 response regulator transcription factor [Megasphaera elsdenii]NME17603.1 response regulator transcription factor [Megasphaera elsdenii]PAK19221.1 DNA-binding response regulator [Megasphaera elsdenii]
MPLIYCVEDDENIRELVGYALRSQDFEVETFADSKEFWPALEKRMPALLLLDIMLPGESGNDILEKLRKTQPYKTLPVIMLTAKTSEYDIVKGLDGGADDYVCKPFGIVELISRIRAVLRRSGRQNTETNLYTYGPVALDQEKHVVTVEGKPCHLTVKEFELLRYLLVNTDIVLKREQIMEAVWGFTYEGESRTIDMHIKSLRQKLGDGGKIIHTVRGVGYVIGGNV